MAGRVAQVREAAREQERKYEAERKTRQAEIEGMIDKIQAVNLLADMTYKTVSINHTCLSHQTPSVKYLFGEGFEQLFSLAMCMSIILRLCYVHCMV